MGRLSSVSFPAFLLFQMIPSGKVSLLVVSVRTRVMLTSSLGRELGCWLYTAALPAPLPAKPGGRWRLWPQWWESCPLVPSEATKGSFFQPRPAGQGSREMAGALQEFLLSTLLWHWGHGSPEQNFRVPTETAPTERFCTEICILQAAGEALELFWEKGPFPNTRGKLERVTVGQALISSSPHCV